MNRVKAGRGRRLLPAFLLIFALLLPCPAAALDLEEELGPLFEEYRLTENNLAMGFRSMHDGTEYWYNEDKLFETASLYKLPLNMYFYELEAAGELSPEDKVAGIELSRCHELSLVNSNNEISMAMVDRLGSYAELKRIALGYCGMSEEEAGPDYYPSVGFTARMMVGILQYLYDRPETFAEQIALMKTAQPDEYLRSGSCEYEIAQKYGAKVYDDGILNVCIAGIVYTDEPFLVAIYTHGVGGAGELMGKICDVLVEYEEERQAPEPSPEPTPEVSPAPGTDLKALLCLTLRMALRLAFI